MKKIIIFGYFVLVFIFSFFIVRATASLKMDGVEVNYRKDDKKLTDQEVIQRNIQIDPDKEYTEYYELLETRTKTILGWDTKIDTVKKYVMERSR